MRSLRVLSPVLRDASNLSVLASVTCHSRFRPYDSLSALRRLVLGTRLEPRRGIAAGSYIDWRDRCAGENTVSDHWVGQVEILGIRHAADRYTVALVATIELGKEVVELRLERIGRLENKRCHGAKTFIRTGTGLPLESAWLGITAAVVVVVNFVS